MATATATAAPNSIKTAPALAVETTPLISKNGDGDRVKIPFLKPLHSMLLCGFLVSLSFGVTQVPLIYVFRLMTCDAYYTSHPDAHPPAGGNISDRCALPTIEAGTARAVSLLGISTTFFGVANLFLTGHAIKRYGVKAALALQVFWPALRLGIQLVGVLRGGAAGIVIVQCSQLITVVGGPVGYMLALNTYVSEVAGNVERTGALGRLQGCNMFGSAVGSLLGGVVADRWGIETPFRVAVWIFLASTAYVLVFLPWIAPKGVEEEEEQGKKGKGGARALWRVLGPLRSIMPADWVLKDGRVRREYGPPILAAGVFLAVLATGYIPTLLQMYATDTFEFGPKRNSYLVSSHLFLRGMFLILAFPKIIAVGRKVLEKRGEARSRLEESLLARDQEAVTEQGHMAQAIQDEQEPVVLLPPPPSKEPETFEFDLIFTRFSLLADGLLTLGASFVQQDWQMYLIGAVLPLGAGTSSAAKGTILQMVPASDRTDALSAISLVEMIARLSTTFVFGLVFAAFASVGKTYLVFACNAGVALVGFAILLLSRFPPEGSRRLEIKKAKEIEEDDSG